MKKEKSLVPSRLKHFATLCAVGLVVAGCSSTNDLAVTAKFTDPATVRPSATSLGNRHLESGRYGSAIEYFSRRHAENREDMEALMGLAIAYDKIGRFDLSRRYYVQALNLEPQNVVLLNNYGYSLVLQGKADEALPHLRRAESFDAHRPAVLANIGIARLRAEPKTAEVSTLLEGASLSPLVSRVTARIQQLVTLISAEFSQQTTEARVDPKLVVPVPKLRARPPVIRLLRRPTTRQMAAAYDPNDRRLDRSNQRQIVRLEVSNGAGVIGMAARMRTFLTNESHARQLLSKAAITNAIHFEYATSIITYREEFRAQAEQLAAALPFSVELYRSNDLVRDVRLLLGANAIDFDRSIRSVEI